MSTTPARRSRKPKLGRRHKPCHVCGKYHAPWFVSAKRLWVLSLPRDDGKPGYRQQGLSKNHDEALTKWHQLEAGVSVVVAKATKTKPTTAHLGTGEHNGENMKVGQLVNLFLDDFDPENKPQPKISPERFRLGKGYLDDFCSCMGNDTVGQLRIGGVSRVEKWLDSHSGWDGCRRSVVSRVKQVFQWGVNQGYIASSPIKGLKRPKDNKRIHYFTREQVNAILANSNPHFQQAFKVLLLTGCRPEELTSLTRDKVHQTPDGEVFWLVEHKNQKHTGKPRRVTLTAEVQKITLQQIAKFPKGNVFRSGDRDRSMSPEYLNKCLRNVTQTKPCRKLGLNDFQIKRRSNGTKWRKFKYVAYCARHTFAVRLLTGFYSDEEGNPIYRDYPEIAALMGNSAKEVEETYGHLRDETKFLSSRLKGIKLE